jgi:hypothetical protein
MCCKVRGLSDDEPIIFTPSEAAAKLRISERTLLRLKQARAIRWVQLSTRKWGVRPQDLTAYMDRMADGGDDSCPSTSRKTRVSGTATSDRVVSFTAITARRKNTIGE